MRTAVVAGHKIVVVITLLQGLETLNGRVLASYFGRALGRAERRIESRSAVAG